MARREGRTRCKPTGSFAGDSGHQSAINRGEPVAEELQSVQILKRIGARTQDRSTVDPSENWKLLMAKNVQCTKVYRMHVSWRAQATWPTQGLVKPRETSGRNRAAQQTLRILSDVLLCDTMLLVLSTWPTNHVASKYALKDLDPAISAHLRWMAERSSGSTLCPWLQPHQATLERTATEYQRLPVVSFPRRWRTTGIFASAIWATMTSPAASIVPSPCRATDPSVPVLECFHGCCAQRLQIRVSSFQYHLRGAHRANLAFVEGVKPIDLSHSPIVQHCGGCLGKQVLPRLLVLAVHKERNTVGASESFVAHHAQPSRCWSVEGGIGELCKHLLCHCYSDEVLTEKVPCWMLETEKALERHLSQNGYGWQGEMAKPGTRKKLVSGKSRGR